MACTIQEVLKSKRNAGNTASIVIAKLLCDTVSDLPSQTGLTGYELAQGCTAHVIADNQDYMIDSSGNWYPYGGEMWQNVYTKSEIDALLEGKQDELTFDTVPTSNSANPVTSDGIFRFTYGNATTISPASGETYDLDNLPIGRFRVTDSGYAARILNSPITNVGYDIVCKITSFGNYKTQIIYPALSANVTPRYWQRNFRATGSGGVEGWSNWYYFEATGQL